jgi:hypothetical protein
VPNVLVTWTAHPARRRPRDLALVVAVLAITAGTVLMSFRSAYLALLAVVILVVAIAPFLFPTRYTITDEGIEAVRALTRRSRRFADLRRLDVGPGAALASPFARRHFMDRYRGILLLFDGSDRDEVVKILRARIGVARP